MSRNTVLGSDFHMHFCTMALPAHSGPRPLIQFRNCFLQTVGLLWRVMSPSQGSYLNTGQHKHRMNAYTHQSYMPWVGFPASNSSCLRPRSHRDWLASERSKTVHALDRSYHDRLASERAKTVHALGRAATVTGFHMHFRCKISVQ
jgi:hypothetical protein